MPPPPGVKVQRFVPSSSEDSEEDSPSEDDGGRVTMVESFHQRSSRSNSQDQVRGLNDKPPVKPRHKNLQSRESRDRKRRTRGANGGSRERLTGLFTMDKMAYDVILDEDTLTLNLVEGQVRSIGERRKSLSKQNSKSNLLVSESIVIPLRKIYAVNVVRSPTARQPRRSSMDSNNGDTPHVHGACQGIMLLTYERKETSCRYEERQIFLRHPSEQMCQEWVDQMKAILSGFEDRPKNLLVLLQIFSGRKNTRDIYHEKVKPVLKTANCNVETVELDHKEHIKQIVTHLDWNEYDCICVMGGDGTVKTLIHHLLCRVQDENHVSQDPSFSPIPCHLPVGIIPSGTTNNLVMNIHGLDDIYTACVHIVLGHKIRVDIASIFLCDQFRRWAFSAQYGLHGNALRYTDKSRGRPAQILDHAFAKALNKKKLRSYDCEVRYIRVTDPQAGNPMDENVCTIGCNLCNSSRPGNDDDDDSSENGDDDVTAFDPLASSANSNCLIEMKSRDRESERWKTKKGSFISVGVHCLPTLCEHAPQGLSKYTHLADGTMDLILIRDTSRKEIIRYLKRAGTSKNQLDFSFIETFRVRQVTLHQRVDTTWRHKDHHYDEIDYQSTKVHKMTRSKTCDEVEVLGDSDDSEAPSSDDESEKSSKAPSSKAGGDDDSDVDDEEEETKPKPDDSKKTKSRSMRKIFSRQGSLLDLTKKSHKSDKDSRNKSRRLSEPRTSSKSSLSEQEAKKRKEKQVKKEKKKKEKAVNQMRAMWAVDGDLEFESDLQIRVHHKLVTFCGLGIYDDADLGDCKFHYLPVL